MGGGILTHGLAPVHHAIESVVSSLGGWLAVLMPTLLDALFGVAAGALTLVVVTQVQRLLAARKPRA